MRGTPPSAEAAPARGDRVVASSSGSLSEHRLGARWGRPWARLRDYAGISGGVQEQEARGRRSRSSRPGVRAVGSERRTVRKENLDEAVRQATGILPHAEDLVELVPLRMWIATWR